MRILTSRVATADRPVARIRSIASNVSHPRVNQSLVAKRLPIHMLNTPETACCNGRGLGARWDSHWCCGGAHGGGGEGSEQSGEK